MAAVSLETLTPGHAPATASGASLGAPTRGHLRRDHMKLSVGPSLLGRFMERLISRLSAVVSYLALLALEELCGWAFFFLFKKQFYLNLF